ncbi:MAG TPA: chlorite dismutase family protein [Polyangiaceae bacterium]
MAHPSHPTAAIIDLSERGADRNGEPQRLDRRLFFQFIAVQCPQRPGPKAIAEQLQQQLTGTGLTAVIYADLHHPLGLGIVACSEDPERLANEFRDVFASPTLNEGVQIREHYSMLGRSYSTGFESDLEFWILQRPRRTLLDPTSPYAIWYPLRRKGPFERLEPREKGAIMQEHGGIGRAYGDQDLAHDIRLACHGLDANDNDFIVGLIGKDLHPLSHVVQAMRKTVQTAEYMEKMGPFFVGRVLFRIEA